MRVAGEMQPGIHERELRERVRNVGLGPEQEIDLGGFSDGGCAGKVSAEQSLEVLGNHAGPSEVRRCSAMQAARRARMRLRVTEIVLTERWRWLAMSMTLDSSQ